ncbi:restriction endonuclease [Halolamina salina]
MREQFFSTPDRAKNVRLGLGPAGYDIVDEDFRFTEIGEELYELRDDLEAMYDRFAKHILQNEHGLKGIEIVEDLQAQGRRTVNENVKEEFREQYDFHINESSNHWSQMRAWMSKAGVVNSGTHHYDIDRSRIEELIGVDSEDILELDELEDEQQAFLRALALIDPDGPIKNRVPKAIAEEAYGVDIRQSGISKRILNPLQEAGYIEWEHVSGKPNLVTTTEKFDAEVLRPVLEDLAERTGIPRAVLRLSFDEIQEQMDADSTYERGVALETLTVKIGRLLGLDFAGWRVRGRETAGSEVDVVMDDVGVTFNRFQIQCKNTKDQLEAKHIAREVGLSRTLQTNTILMVARGGVSSKAEQYANRVMQHENIAILFIRGDDLDEFDGNEDHLLTTLRGESRRVKNLKRLGREDLVDEDEDEEMTDREEEALEKYADQIEDGDDSQESLDEFS